jgi:radical SAM superfamily enzyme YgiQ (UPF0313 family)
MTIAFINPPWFEQGDSTNNPDRPNEFILRGGIRAGSRWPFTRVSPYRPDEFRFGSYLPQPTFLSFAAAWAARECPDDTIVIRDSIARGESYATFFKWLTALKPDAVIIETGAASWAHDRKMLASFKRVWPDIRIAVAGPTAADIAKAEAPESCHDGVLTPLAINAFLLGEYEKNSVKFIRGQQGTIPFDLLTREEMSSSPYPMFDEDVALNYWDSNPVGAKPPELTVWGSRGCFAICNFCAWPAAMTNSDPLGLGGRKIRFYSPGWIEGFIRERMAVAEAAGAPLQSIRFDGDTENASDKHTLAICEVMKRIGLPWSMMCRADTSTREVWQAMKDAGCFGVKLGFESGSDRIVNQVIKKKLDLKEAEVTAKFIRSIGMSVHSTWMIGSPTETEAETQLTIETIRRFYEEGVHNSHQISGCATIEGTPLAARSPDDPGFVRSPDGQHKIEGMTK